MPTPHPASALAACTLRVRPGETLQRIIPAGRFDAPRGAMQGKGPWTLTAEGAARIIARHASRASDILTDYEHQALLSESNGKPVPAAGWIDPRSLVFKADGPDPGLYGAITWTANAATAIGADEYRYLSPVFAYDPESGEVLDLAHLSLTNTPAIDEPILAALSARRLTQETPPVNETLKALLAALGLPAETPEKDALTAVAALKAKADGADTQIAALKAATPDPARYVPIDTMTAVQTQLAALTAQVTGSEAARVIDAAIDAGKLIPAQRTWAEELGKSNLAALKAFVESAPQAMPANGVSQTNGKAPAAQPGQLTESELAVCKAMGLSHEDFLKSKGAA